MENRPGTDFISSRRRPRCAHWSLAFVACLIAAFIGRSTWAVTTESAEVQRLVAAGLAALEKPPEPGSDQYAERLGGKCVVGLAFLKGQKRDHPRVADAVAACRAAMTGERRAIDVYSNGLAIVFLCELDAKRHSREIEWYLNLLRDRQKNHGGWGYDGNNPDGADRTTGDTSQTQYAALGYWSAYRNGLRIDAKSLESLADWLIRTQDPGGGWGYQGSVTDTSQLISQHDINPSMLAAGLGSVLICIDLIGGERPASVASNDPLQGPVDLMELPAAVRPAPKEGEPGRPAPVRVSSDRIPQSRLFESVDMARRWMDEHYAVGIGRYTFYYLYATERYQSFSELVEGITEEEPKWYNDGYQYLLANQSPDGGWAAGCGKSVDTAFAVLFLLRSTQKSIQATLGEGQLVGGRGLPANVATAKMRGNQIVVEQVQTRVDEMLSMIDDSEQSRLDELASDPTALVVDKVDEKSARRLQQLVRGGEPEVRLLAVRALGRTGNLDYVPTLIYALTDPEPRIVLEARDGLQFISRRFDGYGPPNQFTEEQRFEAVDAWKHWYRTLRPGTLPE